jgi:predicted transglutaminase-like protease
VIENLRLFDFKKQFLPSLEDIENEELKELANKLNGDSNKETLTNILEWEEKNIMGWQDRFNCLLIFIFIFVFVLFLAFSVAPMLLSIGVIIGLITCLLLKYRDIKHQIPEFIITDIFEFLPVNKILKYKLAICGDYAKLTSALLFKLSNSRVYFFTTIPQHVAVGVKINNKYYILDQELPILTKDSWLKRWNVKAANVYASEVVYNSKGELIDVNFKKQGKENLTDFSEKTVNTAELTEKVSKILGISQISQKEKSDFELRLKNYAVYYEADDIVEHSLIRAIKNKLENEFCSKINKISKIKINQNEKDLIVEVYL